AVQDVLKKCKDWLATASVSQNDVISDNPSSEGDYADDIMSANVQCRNNMRSLLTKRKNELRNAMLKEENVELVKAKLSCVNGAWTKFEESHRE
uniref:hypothetical protein n=1 Tax=Acinetobacter baumannii TaxID=470 RepID=UPI001C069EF4